MNYRIKLVSTVATAVLLASGCANTYVKKTGDMNPPPAEAFKNFDRFEIRPIGISPPYAGQSANENARNRMQANLDQQLTPVLATWNAQPAKHAPPRVLRIEPHIRDVRFISGAGRIFGGAFAGSSAISVDVTFTDAATGAVIAKPEFYSQANAFAGAYSFSVADNIMLIRPATLLTEYIKANYEQPVGGRTSTETN